MIMKSFIDLCVEGKEEPRNIHDYVQMWHFSPELVEDDDPRSLQEYLGFSKEEYWKWIHDDSFLEKVIEERKSKL